ncbi:hypothetical protein MBLNU230_g2318t1 [Neophaeotheca triangularis]
MDAGNNIPDPTDWLQTPLSTLSSLESALHCQICKEFYDTPMITSCSHTFCSRCIRTSLSAEGKCPACRASDQASKLRNNWAVEEVVGAFLTARPDVLGLARKGAEEKADGDGEVKGRRGKRKRVSGGGDGGGETAGRDTRRKSRRIAASQGSQPEELVEVVDSEDEEFQPEGEDEMDAEPNDGLVACPLGCGKRMKEEAVFTHLDRCEDEQKQAKKEKTKPPLTNGKGARNARRPEDRIAELSYSMMKENALRKKLAELGLPNSGSKQLMVRRHTEWVNLWNANCDSNAPRTKRELLHDLDTWERTQGGRAPHGGLGRASALMEKDFDGARWANKNKDDFSRLIADAKRKKGSPAESTSQPKGPGENTNHDRPFRKFSEPALNGDESSSHHFPSSSVARQTSPPTTRAAPPTLHHQPSSSGDPNPYENNEKAMTSIRAKVAAANHNEPIRPLMNAGFERPETTQDMSPAQTEHPSIAPPDDASRLDTSTTPAPPEGNHEPLIAQSHFGLETPNDDPQPQDPQPKIHSSPDHPLSQPPIDPNTMGGMGHNHSSGSHPTHLHHPSRKVPMFAVPRDPVSDLDGVEAGSAGGEMGGGD